MPAVSGAGVEVAAVHEDGNLSVEEDNVGGCPLNLLAIAGQRDLVVKAIGLQSDGSECCSKLKLALRITALLDGAYSHG
jgi:hypothetical protein